MAIKVPSKSDATTTVYNLVLATVVNDLNTQLSSKQRVDFLPPTGTNSQAALVTAVKGVNSGWKATLVTQNQPGAGTPNTHVPPAVFLFVS